MRALDAACNGRQHLFACDILIARLGDPKRRLGNGILRMVCLFSRCIAQRNKEFTCERNNSLYDAAFLFACHVLRVPEDFCCTVYRIGVYQGEKYAAA